MVYASLKQRNEIPSGPATFLGAEVKIAFRISVFVISVQGRVGLFEAEASGWKSGGGGNMTALKSSALSLNVEAVFSLCLIRGVCWVFLGLICFKPWKIVGPLSSSTYVFHMLVFAILIERK